jgi:type VI secretion system protein VasJ
MDLLDLGKLPISEKKPTGSNVSYEPEFEELSAEIEKLSSPTATEGVNWKKVNQLATDILENKSKDLRVACQLAVAQIQLNGISGFEVGITVLGDLIDQYWDTLFPPKKRMRGRVGTLTWWVEKSEAILAQEESPTLPDETLESLKTGLDRLIQLFDEKVPDYPSLMNLKRFLDAIPVPDAKPAVEEKQIEEAKAEAPGGTPPQAPLDAPAKSPPAAPPSPEQSVIANAQDAQKTVREAFSIVRKAAAYYRENDLMNPLGYRYSRIAAWTPIQILPPSTDGTATSIPPPDPNFLTTITGLKQSGKYESLISAIEGRIPQYLFWLDLSRFVADALSNMGDRYRNALDAVNFETSAFVYRMPGVEKLCFSDNMPFADPDTQQWLQQISLGASASLSEIAMPSVSGDDPEKSKAITEKIEKAHKLVEKKEIYQAIFLLQEELQKSPSGSQKMRWRFALIQLLITTKKKKIALAHVKKILKDIETYRLEQWDPELAAEGFKLAWLGFNAQSGNDYKEDAQIILDKLAALDPAEAFHLVK